MSKVQVKTVEFGGGGSNSFQLSTETDNNLILSKPGVGNVLTVNASSGNVNVEKQFTVNGSPLISQEYVDQQVATKLDKSVYDSEKVNFATTASVSAKADKTYVDQQLATKQPTGDYATKPELSTKLDTDTYNTEKANFATKTELSAKADTTYVNEQLATKQPTGDYATTTQLNTKLDSSKITSGTADLQAGTSDLATGTLYFVYE